jgi:hypothetical protein
VRAHEQIHQSEFMQKSNELIMKYLKLSIVLLFAFYLYNSLSNIENFHFISGVNLIIHEAGHIIFFFFGQFMSVLGGSLTQVLIPLIFSGYFFFRRELFSGSIVLMWVGESIVDVARYAKDAMVMQLPLLGGDSVIHDWNYLLSAVHLLKYTDIIGGVIYYLGILVVLSGITLAIYSIFWTNNQLKSRGTIIEY